MKRRGVDSLDSWVVAVACGLVCLLATWPMRLGGQLFVSLLDRYETNREAASLPFSLAYLMRSISGPFAGYFSHKLGLQGVTLIGCFLLTVGVGGCYFAENILAIDIFLGLIYGTGLGWSTAVGPEIINQHFNKHRAKANGIMFGGSGLGAFITPPILEIILKFYGVSGSFLIMSAIILNSIPAAMLLIKPRTEKKKTVQHESDYSKNARVNQELSLNVYDVHSAINLEGASEVNKLSSVVKPNSLVSRNSPIRISETKLSESYKNIPKPCYSKKENCQDFPNTFKFSEEFVKTNAPCHDTQISNSALTSVTVLKGKEESRQLENMKGTPGLLGVKKHTDPPLSADCHERDIKMCGKGWKSFTKSLCKNSSSGSPIKVLWSPMFLLIAFIQGAHHYVMYLSWTIVVDLVRSKEVEEYQEVYFVMALSVSDMMGRILLGCVTDSGYMSRTNFCAFCFSIIGLSCLVMPFVSGFFTTMTAICVLGLMCGGNTTGLPGIVTKFIREDKRAMAMSSRLLLYAPMSFTMSPLIGYFRDGLGSYDGLFYLQAIVCAFCTVVLFLLSRLVSGRDKEDSN